MSSQNLFKVTAERKADAIIDNVGYLEMYGRSVEDPVKFWEEEGKRIDWIKPYTKIKDVSYAETDLHIKWFYDGITRRKIKKYLSVSFMPRSVNLQMR